ncbi:MAG: DUF4926 domain-containing protein [Chloroflexi bacterium]|nr:DUF4926 domain-containing protein [Chloroflexota bacterium]
MRWQNYTTVRLLTDAYVAEGAPRGAIGTIIEVYADAYEVEFSRADGVTYAQIVAREQDLAVHGLDSSGAAD